MTDVASDRRSVFAGLGLFATILLFIAWDLVEDYRSGTALPHLLFEFAILLMAAAGIVILWIRFISAREAARFLERDLEAARREARRWRDESRDLLDGLGTAIDRQFIRWELTPAEAEIGLLILKGLTHKEIAQIRKTSERTVRQQARSLYLKAGLAGRAELSAFFLEDLLLPRSALDTPED
jgi:DNA-binding CsgD family transcriptional regulator